MKRPTDALEKEFNAGGVFFLTETSLGEIKAKEGGKWLSLKVDIAVMAHEVTVPDFSFSLVNKRGVAIIASDWQCSEDSDREQKILSFTVSQRYPDEVKISEYPSNLCMSFMDLCFYAGNEALPEGFSPDTFTKMNKKVSPADLGWYLPSRFIDSLIDALGKLNDAVLAGQMQEALLYTVD